MADEKAGPTGPIIVAYIAAVLVGGALLAPPVFWAAQGLGIEGTFARTANLVFAALAFAGFFPVVRFLRLSGADAWGYAISLRQGLVWIVAGFVLGLSSMGLVVATESFMDLQLWDDGHELRDLADAALSGTVTGLCVALVEESVFRGGLQSAFRKSYGIRAGIWATAILYAFAHLLDYENKLQENSWLGGFQILQGAIANFTQADNFGALLTLFAAGILLAYLRQKVGHVYLGIGIHAGWVAVIQWSRKAFDLNDEHPRLWLISDYDNIIGYLSAFMLAGVLVMSWLALGAGRDRSAQM